MSKNRGQADLMKIYGEDPRRVPRYGFSQAAWYLKIPVRTLESWVRGRKYPVGKYKEIKFSEPVINLPNFGKPFLSFINLIEAHILSGIRNIEKIPLYKVRIAVDFLEKTYQSKNPLAEHEFQTDGVDLFIEELGHLINASKSGQRAFREVIQIYLHRIERDNKFIPLKLYPFAREVREKSKEVLENSPKVVQIDPQISFGRPVLVGTGVPTDVVVERFRAGDSINDLAEDYDITEEKVEEAIRYETLTRRAA